LNSPIIGLFPFGFYENRRFGSVQMLKKITFLFGLVNLNSTNY